MCVIVYKPKGTTVAKQVARQCWDANPDGGGLAWVRDGKVVISKGFFSFKRMWREIREHQQGALLLHFRIRTAGLINGANTHPFRVTDQLVMAHNGSLTVVSGDKERSDTRALVEDFVRPLAQHWPNFYVDGGWQFAEKLFTYQHGGKLLFFNEKGEAYVTDKDKWSWHRGCLFSNTYWQHRKVTYHAPVWTPPVGKGWGQRKPSFLKTHWTDARAQLERMNMVPSWRDAQPPISQEDVAAIAITMKHLSKGTALLSGPLKEWFENWLLGHKPGKPRTKKHLMRELKFKWRGQALLVYYNLNVKVSDWGFFVSQENTLLSVSPTTFGSAPPEKKEETRKIIIPHETIYGMKWHDWTVCSVCLGLQEEPDTFQYFQGAGGETFRKPMALICEECNGTLDEPVSVPKHSH